MQINPAGTKHIVDPEVAQFDKTEEHKCRSYGFLINLSSAITKYFIVNTVVMQQLNLIA